MAGALGGAGAAGAFGVLAVDELQQVLHVAVVLQALALQQGVVPLGLLLLALGEPQAQLLPHLRVVPARRSGGRLQRVRYSLQLFTHMYSHSYTLPGQKKRSPF